MDGAGLPGQPCAPVRRARPAAAAIAVADGRRAFLRALEPQDEEAARHFFNALSPHSRYRRFFHGARALPDSVLKSLTEIDPLRHVALVAVTAQAADADRQRRIVADARYVWQDEGCSAEFAIAIADDWQRQGLGRELMRRLVEHARRSGLRRLFGYVLKENGPMTALVRAVGGEIVASPEDEALFIAQIDLPAPRPPAPIESTSDTPGGRFRDSPLPALLSAH
jgi:acetyltransferase